MTFTHENLKTKYLKHKTRKGQLSDKPIPLTPKQVFNLLKEYNQMVSLLEAKELLDLLDKEVV